MFVKRNISGFLNHIGLQVLAQRKPASVTYILKQRAIEDSANYISSFWPIQLFESFEQILDFVLPRIPSDGQVLEFGVFKGDTLKKIVSRFDHHRIIGFDNFRGLEEDWPGISMGQGKFGMGGKAPTIKGAEIIIGSINNSTINQAIEEQCISFMHIDTDTPSVCQVILEATNDALLRGAIIVVDDYHSFHGWRNGQKKKVDEFLKRKWQYIGFGPRHAVIKVVN